MSRITILLIISLLTAATVSSQKAKQDFLKPQIASVRIYGKIQQAGTEMDLTVAIKNSDRIRASLQRYPSPMRITAYYLSGSIYLAEENGGSISITQLAGVEAARQLIEMIAISPERFLSEQDALNLDTNILKGFDLEIQRAEMNRQSVQPEQSLKTKETLVGILLKDSASGNILHRIEYLNPKNQKYPAFKIHNEETGLDSDVKITSIEENPGLPDFLFILPKKTEAH